MPKKGQEIWFSGSLSQHICGLRISESERKKRGWRGEMEEKREVRR